MPTPREFFFFIFQILFVSIIVTYAFSYEVDSQIEKPYQIFMLFFMIGTYAMILQYLVLIPEYMAERQFLNKERSARVVSFGPYIASAMLTEVPRAAVQCCVLIGIVYSIHPLNPIPINKTFCVVCLMVGVCAWQSLICICAVVTDEIGVAYTLSFLVLGSGTLFGGLLIRLSKIPTMFTFLYYISVTAVTQRALVVNDMQCCYLTATCNSIAQDLRGGPGAELQQHPLNLFKLDNKTIAISSFCPPGLQVTGDGSDNGNLGRMYLKVLGLEQDNPFEALFVLFWANIIYRALAVSIMYFREYIKYQLKEEEDEVVK